MSPSSHSSLARQWPAAHPPAVHERVETRCPACRVLWQIHQDMGGFRLRCECGAWVPVPAPPNQRLAVAQQVLLDGVPRELPAPAALQSRRAQPVALGAQPRGPRRVSDVVAPGGLQGATVRERSNWTNRSLLELISLFVALVGPTTYVHMRYPGEAALAAMPFASLASGLLVLMICATIPAYSFRGLRDAKPLHFLEALFVAGGTAGLALAYGQWLDAYDPHLADPIVQLRGVVGLGWALFVVGLCPAIFEELAFRGLLQGRLMALLGRWPGLVITATAFMLAHGISAASPLHLFLGLYLGLLRERSGSLYPGMLLHLVYNSALVVLAT